MEVYRQKGLVEESSAAEQYLRNAEAERASRMDSRIPTGGGHTEDDYFALPDDLRVELIDGVFYDMASPSRPHQKVGFEIGKQLDACIEENGLEGHCFMYVAPSDVALGEKRDTIVQPDVYVHCNREKEIQEGPLRTVPDFVVEVLSPSNPEHDLWRKRELYRRHGVREYWIVNPAGEKVYVFRFDLERKAREDVFGAIADGNTAGFADDADKDFKDRAGAGTDETDISFEKTWTFDDIIPVGVSDGRCSVDFQRIRRKLALSRRETGI
jgi:Uma2 family endonuclease